MKQVGMEDAGYGGGGQVKVGERGQGQQCYRSPNLEKQAKGKASRKIKECQQFTGQSEFQPLGQQILGFY